MPERRHGTSGKPLVSVITIFLDAERFIEEAIESVFAQTYGDWELCWWTTARRMAAPGLPYGTWSVTPRGCATSSTPSTRTGA
jgi:hypothetical protein